ncbi:MAG: hypothetical protein M3Y28_09005 [Armatimonadota bacterium]|nr:hypothetical protein [Armatimonadota bacterium]
MKKLLSASALALALLPLTVGASFAHAGHDKAMHSKKAAAATMYQCQKCHMKMSASQAKKDHYKDPMDGGKLVPMATKGSDKPMGGMKM